MIEVMHRYDALLGAGLRVLEKAGAAQYLNTGCESRSQVRPHLVPGG